MKAMLAGDNPPGIAAELGHVGHRDLVGAVAQRVAQRRQPVPGHRDHDGLPLLQSLGDESHQRIDVFAL